MTDPLPIAIVNTSAHLSDREVRTVASALAVQRDRDVADDGRPYRLDRAGSRSSPSNIEPAG